MKIYLISDPKMATLRSGRKVDANGNVKLSEKVTEDDDSKDKPSKDKTTLVVFLGLLIDLLGKPHYSTINLLLFTCQHSPLSCHSSLPLSPTTGKMMTAGCSR